MSTSVANKSSTSGYDVLSFFSDEQDEELISLARVRDLKAGEILITEGQLDPGLFVVTRGLLDVRVGLQEPISVGKRGPGELLGEVSFLTGEGANATVVAREPSEVLALSAESLNEQLRQNPEFSSRFYKLLAQAAARKLTEQTRRAVPVSLAITHSQQLDAKLRDGIHQIKSNLTKLEAELAKQKHQANGTARQRVYEILDEAMEFLKTIFGPESEVPAVLHADVGVYLRQELLPFVLLSRICERSYTKPRGYAGDFQAIDFLYACQPMGVGRIGPLLDDYFLNIAVARAVRNRRGLLLEVFLELIEDSVADQLQIASLACGPAREIFDLFDRLDDPNKVSVHCLDLDFQALSAVGRGAEERGITRNIHLLQENLVLLATGRHKANIPPQDLMYSIGLIDYFQDKLVVQLLNWIFHSLRPGGQVVIGNFDPRNPDRGFMDHLLEWPLFYRTPDDMHRLFNSSSFADRPVDIRYEQEGINLFASCHK